MGAQQPHGIASNTTDADAKDQPDYFYFNRERERSTYARPAASHILSPRSQARPNSPLSPRSAVPPPVTDSGGFVYHPERIRSQSNVDELVALWQLQQLPADAVAVLQPFGAGNDGQLFRLFTVTGQTFAVKRYLNGISSELLDFHKAVRAAATSGSLPPNWDAQAFSLVRRVVVPTGWIVHPHFGQTCLVFEWFANVVRPLSLDDMTHIESQLRVCHQLGFCHLDVTDRNILRRTDGPALLIDYDCVCRAGRSPIGPIPPESSENIKRRDRAQEADDTHLLNLLKKVHVGETLFREASSLSDGIQRPADHVRAAALFHTGAQYGNADCAYRLGCCYATGQGVAKNLATAFEFFRQAAESGHACAQHDVAVALANGLGVPVNFQAAQVWFQQSANNNHVPAQLALAACYSTGAYGAPRDVRNQVYWLQRAVDARDPVAQLRLGTLYEAGAGVEPNMQTAARLYGLAAAAGNTEAQYRMGICCMKGEGVKKDLNDATRWLTLAANSGHPAAIQQLQIGVNPTRSLIPSIVSAVISPTAGGGQSRPFKF